VSDYLGDPIEVDKAALKLNHAREFVKKIKNDFNNI